MRLTGVAAAAAIAIAGATMFAQNPPARGRGGQPPPPNPLGQPLLDPAGHVRDAAMIHAPRAPEDARYVDVDGRRMKDILKEIVAISDRNRDAGEVFWGRNVGTSGHAETQDWVEAYFRKNKLQNISRKSFDRRQIVSTPSTTNSAARRQR